MLNSLTQFITGNADATYVKHGQEFFKSVDELDTNLRRVDHLALEKKVIEQMMQKITGESGKPEEGEIYQKIADERQVDKYINFYPFFRVLSKVCHLAFTKRKEAAHAKKQRRNEEAMDKISVEIQTIETIQEQFRFFETLRAEAERIRSYEVQLFTQKLESIEAELASAEERLRNFDQDFWTVDENPAH